MHRRQLQVVQQVEVKVGHVVHVFQPWRFIGLAKPRVLGDDQVVFFGQSLHEGLDHGRAIGAVQINHRRALAFAANAHPAIIEGDEGNKRRTHLYRLIKIWQEEMVFDAWVKTSSCTPIQPIVLGSNANALEAAKQLDEAGYWIPAIRPPTVPVGSARLRITFSANHSVDDLQKLISTLKAIERNVSGKISS